MIVLYDELKLPVGARIFVFLFLFAGIFMIFMNDVFGYALGIPMVISFFIFWGLYIRAELLPETSELRLSTRLFGLKWKEIKEQIEVNHIAMTRSFISTQATLGAGRTRGSNQVAKYDYKERQYILQIIYNETEREIIESYSDIVELEKKAVELAIKLKVKVFDGSRVPQTWLDPVSGKRKMVKFKKRKDV